MKHIKLLVTFYCITNVLYSSPVTLDASKLGSTIPEQAFRSKTAGKDNSSKGLSALYIKALNNTLKQVKQKDKRKQKSNRNNTQDGFVVATVGDDVITNIDILNAIKFLCFASNQHYDKNCAKLILNAVLDSLIDDSIRQQFAKLQKMQMNNTVIDEKIEEIAKNNQKTVEELGTAFEEAGIDMIIFRKNLYSKLVLTMFYQMMGQKRQATDDAIKRYKDKYTKNMQKKRYKVCEIFLKVDNIQNKQKIEQQAKSIIELLNKGFSFQMLAENLSTSGSMSLSEFEWQTEESFQKPVLSVIREMKVGTYSDIIELKNGYKIVYLLDKAELNKSGQSETIYNVITGEIPINISSEEEFNRIQTTLQLLSEAKSINEFNRICEIYKIKTDKQSIQNPDLLQTELIKRSKEHNTTGILRIDETSPIKILFIESESVPKAELPSDETIKSIILQKEAIKEFNKNMKKIKAQVHITINKNNLQKVLNNET
ncbi:MAG: peptidylprolyl isomerase [Alphaproteobacteria bacterium]|nr:peptidylprolyl isomerase [Alphaproteobacteria bacterium]